MISVITGHANLTVTWAANLEQILGPGPNFWDYFYFNIQSIAVPTFILISSLLFCLKPVTWARTRSRLQKLACLYLFWVGAWTYYTKPTFEMTPLGLLEFLLRGGGWLFYFIAVLILMTVQTFVIARLSRRGLAIAFVLCALILLGTECYVGTHLRWVKGSYYWLPSCFALIPCFAVWLSTRSSRFATDPGTRWRWAITFLVVCVVAAVVEWQFAAPREVLDMSRRWVPKHARFSIQFGALAVVVLSLGIRRQPGRLVTFLARNSLGIYCLHGFMIGGFLRAADSVLGNRFPLLAIPAACLAVIAFCSLVSEFLRRAFRHRLL